MPSIFVTWFLNTASHHCLASRARGEYLRTHFKNMREVAAALTGECYYGGPDNKT
jgi:hypothetical protein